MRILPYFTSSSDRRVLGYLFLYSFTDERALLRVSIPKWIILKLKRKMEIFITFNTSIKTEETRELYHTSSGEVGGRVVSALTYCSGTVSLTQRLNWRFMLALCLRNERGAIMV